MDQNFLSNNLLNLFNDSDYQTILYHKLLDKLDETKVDPDHTYPYLIQNILKENPEISDEIDNFIFSNSYELFNVYAAKQRDPKDPEDFLYQAQVSWEKRILKSINAMCTEFQIPLVKQRSEKEIKEMREKWSELSTLGKDVGNIRPVYSPKDFLDVLVKLKSNNSFVATNLDAEDWMLNWGLIQVPLRVKSLQELRILFQELAISQQQIGVDDTERVNHQFEIDHQTLAKIMIHSKNAAACQEFAKSGCQLENRRNLWYTILNIDIKEPERNYYMQLKQAVLENDLLIDSLLFMDVKLTASNDDVYFVFEDYLYQVLLPMSRDSRLLQVFESAPASAPRTVLQTQNELGDELFTTYPPSGLVPFHGFSMLAAPLCYFIDDPVELYFVLRKLYMRHFYKLFVVSDDSQGILSLCVLFETLLQALEPDLFFYLRNIGIQPLRLAFKWIMRAFSGYLAADQVLLLWDRIVAYESIELLPLVAIAILSFRKSNLISVKSQTAAECLQLPCSSFVEQIYTSPPPYTLLRQCWRI